MSQYVYVGKDMVRVEIGDQEFSDMTEKGILSRDAAPCMSYCKGYFCTLASGHNGAHIAHDKDYHPRLVWLEVDSTPPYQD